MPVREEITYILVHDRMPYHRKIRGLSDAAFRLLIELWCWCGENLTDGTVDADVWPTMRTAKARRELLDKKLVTQSDENGPVAVHDWLDIQRSTAEVEKARKQKSAGGKLGNHRRHHVNQRRIDPECEFCLKGGA